MMDQRLTAAALCATSFATRWLRRAGRLVVLGLIAIIGR